MSMSHNAKRSWAFLASAAVGLSGIAATPALANQPAPTAQIVSEQAPAAASQSLQDASVDWGVKSSFRRYITGPVAGGSQDACNFKTHPPKIFGQRIDQDDIFLP